ncbi:MAG TPA: S9 family peptidase [Xanthobacteraceae bacterium]|nr:S9 family peptidase [Xanthobacteraceae bacterium]
MPSAAAAPARAKRIPLRDFFRNPERSGFQISPDGNTLSFMQPYQNRMNVFVQPRAGGEPVRLTSETERDVAGYFWKGPRRIVYLKDFKGDENFHLVAADLGGGAPVDLTPFDKVRAMIVDDRYDNDDEMIVALNKRNPEVFDVYRLDLNSRELTLIAENPGNITGWLTDHAGSLRLAIATDSVNTSILHRPNDGAAFQNVITTNFKQQIQPLFFDFDNKLLFTSSNIGRDKAAIVRLDPASAKEDGVIFEHPEVDVGGLDWSHKRKVYTEAQFVTWKRERHFFDAETQAIFADLQSRLPGYEIDLQSNNRDEDVFVVAAWSDRTQGVRYLYERTSGKLTKLAEITPWLDENALAEMKPISYAARDGHTIHGYLTLPRGGGTNLPLVVNPHGGPWARDTWGYNPEVQFLANRGYAVLQVNFRGSVGYGRSFWEASFRQWGKTMQDDVTDGVKYVVEQGLADPKRIAIYGASYGGYATLAGLAFTPELYACGVDYVGVSNLFTFLKTIPPYWKPMLDMFYEMVGNPEKDKELLTAASPVLHADRIRAPLLIAQGAQDPRVNIDESDQMVAALQKHGVPVEYIVKDNEGHGFHNEENRFEFYEAMEKFLDKYLH